MFYIRRVEPISVFRAIADILDIASNIDSHLFISGKSVGILLLVPTETNELACRFHVLPLVVIIFNHVIS